jgi:hypothetical protein
MPQQKGFFSSLFDFSFTSFVTPKIIKVLYALALLFVGIYFLLDIANLHNSGAAYHIGTSAALVIGVVTLPLAFLMQIIYARVWAELVLVPFRILDAKTELLEIKKQNLAQATPITAPMGVQPAVMITQTPVAPAHAEEEPALDANEESNEPSTAFRVAIKASIPEAKSKGIDWSSVINDDEDNEAPPVI